MRGELGAGIALAAAVGSMTLMPQAAPARPVAPSLQALLDTPPVDLTFDPALAAASCPVERGPVKEGADADRGKVSTTVVRTSIRYLRARAKPSTYPRNGRVGDAELRTYQITATLTQFKLESDGDVHLVLKDAAGRSMIAEIPLRSCVPPSSRWSSAISAARSTFVSALRPTTSWHHVKRPVTVRGIGYFDPPHGQAGAAPNGIELHPVVAISFPRT